MASKFYQQIQAKKKADAAKKKVTTPKVTTPKTTTSTSNFTMTPGVTTRATPKTNYNFLSSPSSTTTTPSVPAYKPSTSSSSSNRTLTPKETSAVAGLTAPFNSLVNRITPSTTVNQGGSGGIGPIGQNLYNASLNYTPEKKEVIKEQVAPQGQFDYDAEVQKGIQAYIDGLPKVPEYQPYQNPLNDQILNTLNKIQNYKQFDFDENNPALKQAQDQAIQRVRQDMARRGRVFDTYAGTQEQQAAQGLIPDYYRLARGDYECDRGYQGQVLGALQGVDQAQYGRYGSEYDRSRQGALQGQQDYRDAYDVGQQGAQGEYQRGLTERSYQDQQTQDMEKQEVAEFGTPLSPQMRDYRQSYLDIPQDMKQKLIQLGNQNGGFATAINQMQPNDPMLPMLQAMRANKVLSDPELLARYGSEYGMETGAIGAMGEAAEQQRAEQIQTEALNELEILKGKLQNKKYTAEIEEVKERATKIIAETAYKDVQTVKQELDNEKLRIENSNLPNLLKKDIAEIVSRISKNYSAGRASEATAGLRGEETKTEKDTRQGKLDIQDATIRNKDASTSKLGKELDSLDVDDQYISTRFSQYLESGKNIDEFLTSPAKDSQGYTVYRPATADGEKIPMTIAQTLKAKELKALQGLSEATEGKRDEDLIYLKDKYRENPDILKQLEDKKLTKYLK